MAPLLQLPVGSDHHEREQTQQHRGELGGGNEEWSSRAQRRRRRGLVVCAASRGRSRDAWLRRLDAATDHATVNAAVAVRSNRRAKLGRQLRARHWWWSLPAARAAAVRSANFLSRFRLSDPTAPDETSQPTAAEASSSKRAPAARSGHTMYEKALT